MDYQKRQRISDALYHQKPLEHIGIIPIPSIVDGCDRYVQMRLDINEDELYRLVAQPGISLDQASDGDVVAYLECADCLPVEGQPYATLHFGVWNKNMVESQWGSRKAFRHELDAVPLVYGNYAVIVRNKGDKSMIVS